jgi:hypothetical protein
MNVYNKMEGDGETLLLIGMHRTAFERGLNGFCVLRDIIWNSETFRVDKDIFLVFIKSFPSALTMGNRTR